MLKPATCRLFFWKKNGGTFFFKPRILNRIPNQNAMRKIVILFIAALLLNGCGSTTKSLQQGNYDAVIDKNVKKLIKKPDAEAAAEMDRASRMPMV